VSPAADTTAAGAPATDTFPSGRGVRLPTTLIVMAGLPGVGKSTLAEHLAVLLDVAVVSVDPIESAILSAGVRAGEPTGLAAYLVAETIAEGMLATGQSVMVDAVNAVEPARLQWLALAERAEVPVRVIEVVCSRPDLHRERLESRNRGLSHFPEPTWQAVGHLVEEYAEWSGETGAMPRVTVDSVLPLGRIVDDALAFLSS
jgi:predicted kinase